VHLYFKGYGYYRTLTENPMLEVKPTVHCGHTAAPKNCNQAMTGDASEAFGGWLQPSMCLTNYYQWEGILFIMFLL